MANQGVGLTVELVGWKQRRLRFLDAVIGSPRKRGGKAVKNLLTDSHRQAMEESPVGPERQGGGVKFRDSWRTEYHDTADGGEGMLTNIAPHAGFVVFPTRPHIIRPRSASVLRFATSGGDVVFAKEVQHPGTPGNDVPGRVNLAIQGRAEQELTRYAHDVATELEKVF